MSQRLAERNYQKRPPGRPRKIVEPIEKKPRCYKYKLEANVEMPIKIISNGRLHKAGSPVYPFPLMEIGQSFLIPYEDLAEKRGYVSLNAAIQTYQTSHPTMRFAWRTRYLDQHNEHGWRVWRIE